MSKLGRLMVTAAVLTSMLLLHTAPLPGLDEQALQALATEGLLPGWRPVFSVGAIGLGAIFYGYGLVELCAAVVPKWRASRHSEAGRKRLTAAALALSVLLAAVQASSLSGMLVEQGVLAHSGLSTLSCTLGFGISLGGAFIIDRAGKWAPIPSESP